MKLVCFSFFASCFLLFVFRHSNSGRISHFDIRNPILTFEFGPNIEFLHSKSYFDIRTWTEFRILTFKILFWHSNSGQISNFDIQNLIKTFELGSNIEFFVFRFSFFDIRIRAEYRILTFEILFWHSNSGQISNLDIQYLILTFELGPNIVIWHSKSYFDIRIRAKYWILTFKILFWHSNLDRISNFDIRNPILTFEFGPNIEFLYSKSYFDIRTWTEYRNLTFKILFWHSNWDRISNFDIRNPILTFEFGPNIEFLHSKSYFDIRTWTQYRILTFEILFWHSNSGRISNFDIQNPILTFELGPNIEFWHSKSYFDIRIRAEYRILTFEILFWHSNSGQISNFDIQKPILTFEFGANIEFWHSKSYFDIRIRAKYRILTFKILFWDANLDQISIFFRFSLFVFRFSLFVFRHSNSGRISHFDIWNPILKFKFRPNIKFWHSKSYFDIRTWTEYRVLTFKILFWHSNSGRISNFDIQNLILAFEFGPNIEFWHSKSYFDIRTEAEYQILTFKILFWHSNSGQISNFDIQNTIRAVYCILTFVILFWHSNSDRISNFDIQNLTLQLLIWTTVNLEQISVNNL